MAERKCPFCGSTEFVDINLVQVSGLDIDTTQNVISTACVKCGHVDIVAKPEVIQKKLDTIKAKQEKDAKIFALNKRMGEVKAEIERLKTIIADENQTVKEVNNAKEQLAFREDDLRKLNDELNSLKYGLNYW